MARIAPVCGFSATTAPGLPPVCVCSALQAAFWALELIVRVTLAPLRGLPVSRSMKFRTVSEELLPFSTEFS